MRSVFSMGAKMIKIIKAYDECRDFVSDFLREEPVQDEITERLTKHIANPDQNRVIGVFAEGCMTGLFSFLVLPDEKYIEMLECLSREKESYSEAFQYLADSFPGYDTDFVFNPQNSVLKELLEEYGAEFDTEQQKMVLEDAVQGIDTTGIEPLSEKYAEEYCAIHTKDVYWTGERVLEAQDRFRTFLAVHEGRVVGYIDVTYTYDENEPFSLLVLEEYRRMGYGRKLLARAVGENKPCGMVLHVDVDNTPAIRLYESMGFRKEVGGNTLTSHLTLSEKN